MFTYMVALNTNVINFDEKHRGKVVGLLNAFFAGSPSVFASIYYHAIGNPNSSESFATMMLMFAIAFGVTDIICMIFLRVYQKPCTLNEEIDSMNTQQCELENREDPDSKECCENPQNRKAKDEGTSLLELLRNVDFYIFTFMFTFASTVGLTFVVGLTQTTDAMGFGSHDEDVVLIVPITNALISVSVGVFSDWYKDKFPRLSILIVGCAAFVVCEILILALAEGYIWIVISTVFCGIGIGFIWSISPTIMSELFSVANLGRNWGIALFLGALVGLGGQESFGAFYDAAKKDSSDINCYGIQCIRGGHAVALGFACLAVIFGIGLVIKRRQARQHDFQRF